MVRKNGLFRLIIFILKQWIHSNKSRNVRTGQGYSGWTHLTAAEVSKNVRKAVVVILFIAAKKLPEQWLIPDAE